MYFECLAFCDIQGPPDHKNILSLQEIEEAIGTGNILSSLMVDVEYEKRHGSLAAQCVYSLLALVDNEHSAKSWNKHAEFLMYLSENKIQSYLFHYKDNRFDGIGRAAAVLLFHWEDYFKWLNGRTDVTNKLACFSRSLENIKFLRLELLVLASFGLQVDSTIRLIIFGCNNINPKNTIKTNDNDLTKLYFVTSKQE